MNVYMGRRRQRGHGIGSLFSSLVSAVKPFAFKGISTLAKNFLPKVASVGKNLVTNVGKEALKTGVNIATDYLAGKNPRQAAVSQMAHTGQQVMANPTSLLRAPPPPPPPKRTAPKPKKKTKGLKRKSRGKTVSTSVAAKRSRPRDIFDDK